METFTLQRTALPELTFNGRLLVRSDGNDTDEKTQGRVHDIAVYETDDGAFIVSIQYRSPFASELSDSFVDAVDSPDEVEAALSLYDAKHLVDSELFGDQDTLKQPAVVAALVSRFDRQVVNVLEALATRQYA